jgi:hypothetical protein
MKIKRTLVILAAMMMPITMLAGCGNSDRSLSAAAPSNGAGAPAAKGSAAAKKDDTAKKSAEVNAAVAEKAVMGDADASLSASIAAEGAPDTAAKDAPRMADVAEAEAADALTLRPDVEPDIPPAQTQIRDDADAFILTAGEWNDNENYGFFQNLIKQNKIRFPAYGLDPKSRITATVQVGGKPAQNVKVELLSESGNVLWTAQTDKNGNAYLFCNYADALTVRALDQTVEVEKRAGDEQSGDHFAADQPVKLEIAEGEPPVYDKTEVMFILDTTGSMGDEITYLQKDFSAIAEETAADNVFFSMNFYKDEGDTYVTKCNSFTQNVKEVQSQINQEAACGGGDTPEAVAEILEKTITKGDWSADANKIAFLIFDAPPHDDDKSIQKVQTAIASAAEQGIHLVPVVASNSDRETELFGRAAAVMTNSNYVFLTDDSGVGGSHLEPIIGDYEVEKLHDIIVRNIKEIAK